MDETTKPRRQAFKYGCLFALVLLLMVILGGLLGLYYARKMFNDFTDTKPAPLPEVRMSQAEINQLQKRVDRFRQDVRAGKPVEPLKLSSDEINALIATDPDLRAIKGKIYVTLSDKKIQGQLSVPMESLGLPVFRGRYLNGTGTFDLSLRNGQVQLRTLDFEAKGRKIPSLYMDQIRKQNLAEGINSQPRAAAALDWLKQVTVEDGKLVLVPKPKP